MPSAGFELRVPATEHPQTNALDRSATGISRTQIKYDIKNWCKKQETYLENLTECKKYDFFLVRQPTVGQGLLIHNVSRSHIQQHITIGRTPLDE